MEQIVFTPSAVLDFLSNVEELKEFDIGLSEYTNGEIVINIGDSTYTINPADATDVEVAEDVVEVVEDTNMSTYDEIEDAEETPNVIEGGLIKTVAKALLLRGLIKLSSKLLN